MPGAALLFSALRSNGTLDDKLNTKCLGFHNRAGTRQLAHYRVLSSVPSGHTSANAVDKLDAEP